MPQTPQKRPFNLVKIWGAGRGRGWALWPRLGWCPVRWANPGEPSKRPVAREGGLLPALAPTGRTEATHFFKKSQTLTTWRWAPARHPVHRAQVGARAFERQPWGWRNPPGRVNQWPERHCSTPRLPAV
jgi:hypothetical protein